MSRFRDRLQSIKSPADKRLRSERERLYNKVRQLEQDIALLENNVGFFSKSKNAEAVVADIREKIAASKQQLQDLIEKGAHDRQPRCRAVAGEQGGGPRDERLVAA